MSVGSGENLLPEVVDSGEELPHQNYPEIIALLSQCYLSISYFDRPGQDEEN